ncbi:hypothetical protein D0863_06103 [Hortaea werneckii]|uniref:Uncharacterized protein n=1 Tax=Hortaea werneckii TaxID=91943 RepID=A0A3M7DZV1_HORWE|nr:hypothetical protein D0863_06103 [Hortaea werneckii]
MTREPWNRMQSDDEALPKGFAKIYTFRSFDKLGHRRHFRILPNCNLAYNGVHPDALRLFPLWQSREAVSWFRLIPLGRRSRDGKIHWRTMRKTTLTMGLCFIRHDSRFRTLKQRQRNVGFREQRHETSKSILIASSTLPRGPPHFTRDNYPLINSVALLRDGNILASLRSVSAVIIINRDTGKVIWHLDSTVVAQQHHATEMEDGSILIFDNGVYRHHESFPYSRVIQVDRATRQIVWQYREKNPMTFFTPFMGGAQRLANGNTLITEAANSLIFEVTGEGEMAWEYVVISSTTYDGLDATELEGMFGYPANAILSSLQVHAGRSFLVVRSLGCGRGANDGSHGASEALESQGQVL